MTELEERRVRIGDLLRHLLIDVEGFRRLTDEPPEGDIDSRCLATAAERLRMPAGEPTQSSVKWRS